MVQAQVNQISPRGIQSFIDASPDYALAPIGLGSMENQAAKLAEYGRNGDIYVIHAAEGETVIPMEVLEANPQIKALLFNQMAEMGLDPQRYVVGDQLNSLNPVTGMPEFFFSSIFKGVKKVVKKVAKVVKKAAPIILPIAASMFGVPFLGPMFAAGTIGAAALGSGIGTLVGGGSLKDAFKSALFAGATAGITKGIGSLAGGDSFGKGFMSSLTGKTPVGTIGGEQVFKYAPTPSQQWKSLTAGKFSAFNPFSEGSSLNDPFYDAQGNVVTGSLDAPYAVSYAIPDSSKLGMTSSQTAFDEAVPIDQYTSLDQAVPLHQPTNFGSLYSNQAAPLQQTNFDSSRFYPAEVADAINVGNVSTDPGFWRQYSPFAEAQYKTSAGTVYGSQAVEDAQTAATNRIIAAANRAGISTNSPAVQKAVLDAVAKVTEESLKPGLIQQYGPLAGIALAGAGLGGAFKPAETEEVTQEDLAGVVPTQTGAQLLAASPGQFQIGAANLDPFANQPDPNLTSVPSIFAQEGGYVNFPRRNGHITGPGGPKDDLVPAMLSNNEFVMPAEAVDGAGGPDAMYALMRNFQMNSRRGVT